MTHDRDFEGQCAFVTGASRGIGRAIASAFAARGARVAVCYQGNEAAARETLGALHGDGHCLVRADLADAAQTERAVAETIEALGGLHIVVNNAGIFEHHPPLDTAYDDWYQAWQTTLAVNLTGPANVCWCAARHMREHGGGRIINVSSRGAFRGEPNAPAYGASKAGLNAMSQSLAIALAPHGISVGVVAPGFVETDMAQALLDGPGGDAIRAQSPLNRVARPDEVAAAVLFLATPGAAFATGTIIDVNGASYLRS